jgi:hypothetical protein
MFPRSLKAKKNLKTVEDIAYLFLELLAHRRAWLKGLAVLQFQLRQLYHTILWYGLARMRDAATLAVLQHDIT